ncbi:MAG: hypothetical protein IPO56_16315 [Flavobacteriales bacterium]|nr:hypothetical protein [Flavobacteriales bacterium]
MLLHTILRTYGEHLGGGSLVCIYATGSLQAQPSGGTAPYTFAWSNGSTEQGIIGLVAGTYSVTVTDAVSATATAEWTFTEDPLASLRGCVPRVSRWAAGSGVPHAWARRHLCRRCATHHLQRSQLLRRCDHWSTALRTGVLSRHIQFMARAR